MNRLLSTLVGIALLGINGMAWAADKTASTPPATDEVAGVVWGEVSGSLQTGLIPLGEATLRKWRGGFCPNPKCGIMEKTAPGVGKCSACGQPTGSTSLHYCASCAAAKRVCQSCGAVKPCGSAFDEGEPIRLEIHLKNAGEIPLKVARRSGNVEWTIRLVSKADGSTWLARFHAPGSGGPGMPMVCELAKGEEATLDLVLSRGWRFDKEPAPALNPLKEMPSIPLPPGKYTVTATSATAKVTTGAVGIEIKAKGQ